MGNTGENHTLSEIDARVPEVLSALFPGGNLHLWITFHSLNGFWLIKIVKKARRKILRIEKVQDSNNYESNDEYSKKKD